ncbi:hypothetical protein K8R47_02170, partial [archaeon]|nr:hypothetical protein [archaeon]
MVNIIKKILKYDKEDSLIRDGIILVSSSLILSIAGYFYHFYMGRTLGPESYGILGVILSVVYILLVPAQVIQTTI